MAVGESVLDLVDLLYRADWTRLSLALEVTEFDDYQARSRIHQSRRPSWAPPPGTFADQPGRPPSRADHWQEAADRDEDEDEGEFSTIRQVTYRLLVAPGGMFREENDAGDTSGSSGSDSKRALPPCAELLLPSWLPACFQLELAGSAQVCARPGHRVIGRPRPLRRDHRTKPGLRTLRPPHRSGTSAGWPDGIDSIDAVVDAEFGILLRSEQMYRGQVVSRREITAVTLDPPEAADSSGFTERREQDDPGSGTPFSGPGWDRAKAAANAGASALSFAIRHAPHREPPAGSRAGSPPIFPARGAVDWPGPPGPDEPVSAHIIGLLYEAGLRRSGFDAELTTWGDAAANADAFQWATRNAALSGVSQLGAALREHATTWQRREAISLGLPEMYRIDYIDGGMRHRKTTSEVSDGAQRWRVFANHMTVGPALPPPEEVARLADPSWLLDWQLTGGAEVIESGRRGYLIRVRPRHRVPGAQSHLGAPADVLVDAELGVLLRLTEEQAGRPSRQQALTKVTVRPHPDPADFRIAIPAGMRVIPDSETVLDTAELPAPMQTAVHLTVKAVSAAARVGGFLDSLRRTANRPGPGQR